MFVLFAYKMAGNLGGSSSKELVLSTLYRCLLVKWKVFANQKVSKGSILAVYKKIKPNLSGESDLIVLPKLKSDMGGLVKQLLVAEGDEVEPGFVNGQIVCSFFFVYCRQERKSKRNFCLYLSVYVFVYGSTAVLWQYL